MWEPRRGEQDARALQQLLPEGHPDRYSVDTLGLIMNKTGRSLQAESILRQAAGNSRTGPAKGSLANRCHPGSARGMPDNTETLSPKRSLC